MSRKVIRDFIKQADRLSNTQAEAYFDRVIEVYEDSIHTAQERVATLESDTLWLLAEYRKIVEAKDNSPEEKQKHRIAQSNIWQLLSVLIASTADKGIYLSEAFIDKYDRVEFVGGKFGEYVRDTYNVRKWKTLEPQPKADFAELFPEKSKAYFDRLVNAGYCDKTYSWIKGTQYQAAQAGYHISMLTWRDIKWKPFEKFWGLSNMAQTFSNNRTQANQESINEIDYLFPENCTKKDLVKL